MMVNIICDDGITNVMYICVAWPIPTDKIFKYVCWEIFPDIPVLNSQDAEDLIRFDFKLKTYLSVRANQIPWNCYTHFTQYFISHCLKKIKSLIS